MATASSGLSGPGCSLNRKVVVGFWQDDDVNREIGAWSRAAAAWHDAQSLKIARFGDNMRDVAVTEGDKVAAQIRLGYSVNGYGIGDLAASAYNAGRMHEIDKLTSEYEEQLHSWRELLRAGEADVNRFARRQGSR